MSDDTPLAEDRFADLFRIPPGTPSVLIHPMGEPGHAERCKAQFEAWQAAQREKRKPERRRGRGNDHGNTT